MPVYISPQVVALFTATSAGQPMDAHSEVEVRPGVGIPGDRYSTGKGHWSDPRWPDQEFTLVGVEVLKELGIEPSDLRRNAVTAGIDLLDLIGLEFAIGTARFRGARPCSPCHYIESLNGRPGLLKALEQRGGLRAAVLRPGVVRVGDELRVVGIAKGC